MCKAPKPPKQKEPKKPQFLRNRYLDEFVGGAAQINSLRTGRSSLRIPTGGPAPITGRQPGDSLVKAPVDRNTSTGVGAGARPPGMIAGRRRPGETPRHLR
jgi:hypothetical protein